MASASRQQQQGSSSGEERRQEEDFELGDGIALSSKGERAERRGVYFGRGRKGEIHVRLLDPDRWPQDLGSCENWNPTETRRVTRTSYAFQRQLAYPPGGQGPLLVPVFLQRTRCNRCAEGLREMKRIVSAAE